MNRTARTQLSAFALAALMTLTVMASIQQLSAAPVAEAAMASAGSAPAQVVVVTGKRAPRV